MIINTVNTHTLLYSIPRILNIREQIHIYLVTKHVELINTSVFWPCLTTLLSVSLQLNILWAVAYSIQITTHQLKSQPILKFAHSWNHSNWYSLSLCVTFLSGPVLSSPLAYLHIILQQSWSRLIFRVVHISAHTDNTHTQLQTSQRVTAGRNW